MDTALKKHFLYYYFMYICILFYVGLFIIIIVLCIYVYSFMLVVCKGRAANFGGNYRCAVCGGVQPGVYCTPLVDGNTGLACTL